MKYCRIWKQDIEILPEILQQTSINYKKWKKLLKNNVENIQDLLEKACFDIDVLLNSEYHNAEKTVDVRQLLILYNFAKINAKTLYKICKRIDKNNNDFKAISWLVKIRSDQKYIFISGILYTKLALYAALYEETEIECAICLGDLKKNLKKIIVLPCGHYLCLTCFAKLQKNLFVPYNPAIDYIGTKYTYVICPICKKICDRNNCQKFLKSHRCCLKL